MPNTVPELEKPFEGSAQHTPVKIPEEVSKTGVEPVHEADQANEIMQNHPAEDVTPSKTEALHTPTDNAVPHNQFEDVAPAPDEKREIPKEAQTPSLAPNKRWGPLNTFRYFGMIAGRLLTRRSRGKGVSK